MNEKYFPFQFRIFLLLNLEPDVSLAGICLFRSLVFFIYKLKSNSTKINFIIFFVGFKPILCNLRRHMWRFTIYQFIYLFRTQIFYNTKFFAIFHIRTKKNVEII